jgi:homogentisate 1,2-dioxygenase
MPYYKKMGNIPNKRHIQFRAPNGNLYHEELISSEGFSNLYSLAYHIYPPTVVKSIGQPIDYKPKILEYHNMQHRSYKGWNVEPETDYLKSRKTVLMNNDIQISLAAPTQSMQSYFFKNAQADEIIFIHKGSGTLMTAFGSIKFQYGDYVHIPRGTIYQLQFDTSDNRLLIIESFSPVEFPRRYMNKFGQLLEHSPFYERDIHGPEELHTYDQKGEFLIYIKKEHFLYPYIYANHPFDYVGWDGCFYPYKFSIHDFEPITGRVHQPPPVHQTFEAHNFVICSFVPRLYDYHPLAIPAPYHHSNIDSDEVLYYVDGDFMSRNNIEKGQITLHPMGIPHGPHPGAIERSIGAKETHELAVMIDTFKPLWLTDIAEQIEIKDYFQSWLH